MSELKAHNLSETTQVTDVDALSNRRGATTQEAAHDVRVRGQERWGDFARPTAFIYAPTEPRLLIYKARQNGEYMSHYAIIRVIRHQHVITSFHMIPGHSSAF